MAEPSAARDRYGPTGKRTAASPTRVANGGSAATTESVYDTTDDYDLAVER